MMTPTPDTPAQPPPDQPPAAASSPTAMTATVGSDSGQLNPEQAQALLRLIESAAAVRRRYQFFVWTQNHLQALVPHRLMVCGAYLRQRRAVVFDVFHNVVLAPTLLAELTDPDGALTAAAMAYWQDGRGQPCAWALERLGGGAGATAAALVPAMAGTQLLLHGVARPQRPTEIESFFIFGGPGSPAHLAQRSARLDLVLPQLHTTLQRVTATEHDLRRAAPPLPTPPAQALPPRPRGAVTERERQILRWVREGKSNPQIGEVLGISPLTVKNHVQKILRKLGAGNRTQAVAQALAQNLIDPADRLAPAPAQDER